MPKGCKPTKREHRGLERLRVRGEVAAKKRNRLAISDEYQVSPLQLSMLRAIQRWEWRKENE